MADQKIYTFQIHAAINTYVSGDVIDVVIDDTTQVVSVKKNNVTITSGDDLIAQDYLDGKFSFSTNNYKYCDGDNLVTYDGGLYSKSSGVTIKWRQSFPYHRHRVIAGAATCKGTACDISKEGSPVVTGSSSETAGDATVKLSVFSSKTVKFWKSEFAYDQKGFAADSSVVDGSGHVYTYTFLNLKPGKRRFFATDSGGCSLRWKIEVPINEKDNTYGLRYRGEWNDTPTSGTGFSTWRIDLKFKGFTDASGEIVSLGNDPLKITFGKGSTGVNKFQDNINASSCVLSLKETVGGNEDWISVFGYTQEKQVLAEVYRDDVLYFSGYNLPEQYGEPWQDKPFDISIRFTDGLIDLKNYDYVIDQLAKDPDNPGETSIEPKMIKGRSSAIEILSFCLNKTGLNKNIISCLNTYSSQMDTGNADDPLAQEYFNNDAFYEDDGTPYNCFRVIESILRSYPVYGRIMSYGDSFYILPIEATGSLDYRKFDYLGAYDSSGALNPILNITDADGSGMSINSGSYTQLDETYKEVQIVKPYRVRESILPVFDKSTLIEGLSGKSQAYRGWSLVNNGGVGSWDGIVLEGDKYALQFNMIDGYGATSYALAKGYLEYQSNDKFELSFTPFFNPGSEIKTDNALPPWVPIRWSFKVGTYYYNQNGTWSTTETINEYFFSSHGEETKILYIDNFRTGVDKVTEAIEFRVFDADVKYHQLETVASNSANRRAITIEESYVDISGVDVSTLNDGNRLITRVDFDDGGEYTNYYHTLRESSADKKTITETSGTRDTVEVVLVNDDVDEKFRWMLDGSISVLRARTLGSTFYFRSPVVKIIPNGSEYPNEEIIKQGIDKGNLRIREFELPFFGAPLDSSNAKRSLKNVILDASGNNITEWGSRDRRIEEIQMDILRRHYKRPLKRVTFSGFINGTIYPYSSIRDTSDSNRIYILDSLTLSTKYNTVEGELVEVTSDNPIDPTATTTGFSIGIR